MYIFLLICCLETLVFPPKLRWYVPGGTLHRGVCRSLKHATLDPRHPMMLGFYGVLSECSGQTFNLVSPGRLTFEVHSEL